MGVRTGKSALLHRKARARVELPPVSTLSIHPLFCAVACASASAPSAAVSSYFSSARGRAGGAAVQSDKMAGRAGGVAVWIQERQAAQAMKSGAAGQPGCTAGAPAPHPAHSGSGRSLDSSPIFCSGVLTSTWLSMAT